MTWGSNSSTVFSFS